MSDERFLSRWARRKSLGRTGETHAVRAPGTATPLPLRSGEPDAVKIAVPAPLRDARPQSGLPTAAAVAPALDGPDASPADPPAPTMADVQSLDGESDFKPFMQARVEPAVRNAALRKLFSDPHFNVMDGLDTYIDDYGKPDPLPPGMLESMQQWQALIRLDVPEASAQQEPAESGPADPDTPAQEPGMTIGSSGGADPLTSMAMPGEAPGPEAAAARSPDMNRASALDPADHAALRHVRPDDSAIADGTAG